MSATAEATAQHLVALDLANRVRLRRVEVRHTIRALPPHEAVTAALDVLFTPEPHLRAMTVYRLLTALQHYGRARVLRVLRAASVSEQATLARLTDRQREAIRDQLGGKPQKPAARRARADIAVDPPVHCQRCHTRMLTPHETGQCGFCIEEQNFPQIPPMRADFLGTTKE